MSDCKVTQISPLIAVRRYMLADETPLGIKHIVSADELKVQTSELSALKAACQGDEMKELGQQAIERLNELNEKLDKNERFELKPDKTK